MVSSATEFLIWSLNASMGAAAKGTMPALSIWKLKSGIGLTGDHVRSRSQSRKEVPDLSPDLGSP